MLRSVPRSATPALTFLIIFEQGPMFSFYTGPHKLCSWFWEWPGAFLDPLKGEIELRIIRI